ncbi:uncharacterized protein LOC113519699 [Galleria mellonella]|uniref:Uncharacterized protein LOC113519699 n=2 Tax=Galleria mellonella TaxID=7137 RepID=A0ABM3MYF3_GALME|nr:uncharacterized protein LOC113519699 [Galleria mellonella]
MALNSENLFLNRAKIVMKIMGVWIPPPNESIISKIYKFIMMFFQYLILLFLIIYVFQMWGDLDAVSQAFYVLFTQASLCFKVTVFLVNKNMLMQLLKQMKSDIFAPKSAEHESILILYASKIKRLLLMFMIAAQTTCALWALKPLFDDVGSRKFPIDMWMPVTSENSPQYELGFVFQFVTITISAYMYFGVDSVALSMIMFGCAQIDIVKDKIMTIVSIHDAKEDERKKILQDNHKKLVECVIQHGAIASFIQITENAYHTYLFFQLTGSVGIYCMSALRILVIEWQSMQFFSIVSYLFVITSQLFIFCWCGHELTATIEWQSMQFFSIVSYLFVITSQLFIFCWCGHELTATSEDLHTVMYKCLWYEQDLKFKRDLCFAMMRMSRPMIFRAGHYVMLSRQTFVAILRMSYSYFAVLNQTKKNIFPTLTYYFNMSYNNAKLFLELPTFLLKYLGLWIVSERFKTLNKIYRTFGFVLHYSVLLSILIYLAVVWGNIDAMSNALYILFTQTSTCFKITAFTVNKKRLLHLLAFMNTEILLPKTKQQECILMMQARKARYLTIFLVAAANINVMEWCVIPLLHQDEPRTFPYTMWMPVDTQKSPDYQLGYFYQVMFGVMCATMFMAIDAFIISSIMFACAQLDIIRDKIQKVQSVELKQGINLTEKYERWRDNNKLFDECITQHQSIIQFVELVESLFHFGIFFQLSGSVGIVCMLGFRLSVEPPNTYEFYSLLNYMVNMLAQVYFYCWSGNELTKRSQDLRNELYLSQWYEQDASFRKKLPFAMECMKKPILFKAGHFITLSRPTFVSILRCSYSYFALLNQVNNKQ